MISVFCSPCCCALLLLSNLTCTKVDVPKSTSCCSWNNIPINQCAVVLWMGLGLWLVDFLFLYKDSQTTDRKTRHYRQNHGFSGSGQFWLVFFQTIVERKLPLYTFNCLFYYTPFASVDFSYNMFKGYWAKMIFFSLHWAWNLHFSRNFLEFSDLWKDGKRFPISPL